MLHDIFAVQSDIVLDRQRMEGQIGWCFHTLGGKNDTLLCKLGLDNSDLELIINS